MEGYNTEKGAFLMNSNLPSEASFKAILAAKDEHELKKAVDALSENDMRLWTQMGARFYRKAVDKSSADFS